MRQSRLRLPLLCLTSHVSTELLIGLLLLVFIWPAPRCDDTLLNLGVEKLQGVVVVEVYTSSEK